MFFINLIFAIAPFLGFTVDLPATVAGGEYCNDRFGFCVTYPDNYFSVRTFSDNGDGVIMTARGGQVELDISGEFNVMNWSVQDIIDSYLRTIQENHLEIKFSEIKVEITSGWAKIKYDDEIQLFRVNQLNDVYVTTIITIPAAEPDLLEQLNQAIQVSFTAL